MTELFSEEDLIEEEPAVVDAGVTSGLSSKDKSMPDARRQLEDLLARRRLEKELDDLGEI